MSLDRLKRDNGLFLLHSEGIIIFVGDKVKENNLIADSLQILRPKP